MFKPLRCFIIFAAFLFLGAGCQIFSDTSTPIFGSRVSSLLGEEFYGYMRWVHIDPGLQELQYTVGGEADIVLRFSRVTQATDDTAQAADNDALYDVEGVFVPDMSTMVCSGNASKTVLVTFCQVKEVNVANIAGTAALDDGVLNVTLSWSGASPQEITQVRTETILGILDLDQVSMAFASDLAGEEGRGGFIGDTWSFDLLAGQTPFVEDAFAVASSDEAGIFSDLPIPYALKSNDAQVQSILDSATSKTFTASPLLLGESSGSLYFFDSNPNITALKLAPIDF